MATAGPPLVIRNEQAAFDLLKTALEDQFDGSTAAISFQGWPKLSIRLEGAGYNSTITPDVAEVLVGLQHALNRAYARAIHHSTNARKLTLQERRELQFKAKVEQGSSLIQVDLGDYVKHLITALAGKMDAKDIIITVLGLGLVGASTVAFRTWLKHKSEDNKVEAETKARIAMNAEETRRMEILATAMADRPQLGYAKQDFDDLRRDILKSVADANAVSVNGIRFSNAEARALSNTPRSESEAVQLNGHYTIQKIDLNEADVIRLSLRSTDNSDEFVATLQQRALEADQRAKLETGAWNRRRLYMAINGTRLRGEVTAATIISVDWPAGS